MTWKSKSLKAPLWNAPEEVIRSLEDLRHAGVHLIADDFGTGYASLSYLRDFPLDGIKVDTTFVADIDPKSQDGGLAAAVIAVGNHLGMQVVAEGVETEAQLNFLRDKRVRFDPGFLHCAPGPG